MTLSSEEKHKIEALVYMNKTEGWNILKEYFIKEVFDSVHKKATEKDIQFYAGVKEVFIHVDEQVSKLNK